MTHELIKDFCIIKEISFFYVYYPVFSSFNFKIIEGDRFIVPMHYLKLRYILKVDYYD